MNEKSAPVIITTAVKIPKMTSVNTPASRMIPVPAWNCAIISSGAEMAAKATVYNIRPRYWMPAEAPLRAIDRAA